MSRTNAQVVTFLGGETGLWTVDRVQPVTGESLAVPPRLEMKPSWDTPPPALWALRGTTSNHRYVEAREKVALDAVSPTLGRTEATRGALIPIRKTAAWWALSQDQRRAVFEERSHHIADSMDYLPRIARRLFHSRDLGEPFDFLTWFEFAPEHEAAFDALLVTLRATEEWQYVDREVDIRVGR